MPSQPTTSISCCTALASKVAGESEVAQFDVYRNANSETNERFPFLVDVQAELFEELQSRVVIPLSKAELIGFPMTYLTPTVSFDGLGYLLIAPQLAGISRAELGPRVGTLIGEERTITTAIEFLMRGF
jgi:toxin CcdB